MKVYDTVNIASTAVAAHPARPATSLVHDSADARVVLFRLDPGQEVAVHTSASTVMLTILAGKGSVSGADGERNVRPGDIVVYDAHEPHGMRAAGDDTLLLLATITPRPGAR